MQIRMTLAENLRPEILRWLEGMSPTAISALRAASRLITHRAVAHMIVQLLLRTGKLLPFSVRSLATRITRTGGHPYATIWWKRGIAAAHEIGATIPAKEIRPRRARVLRFQAGGQVRFAQFARIP